MQNTCLSQNEGRHKTAEVKHSILQELTDYYQCMPLLTYSCIMLDMYDYLCYYTDHHAYQLYYSERNIYI